MNVSGQPTFSCSDLPGGLTLSNTGLISGTPTISGEGSSTIIVSYTGSQSKTIILNWNIEAAEEETHDYVYTLYGATNPNVNGNYWDVRDQFERFYDSEGNPVDSFDNAAYMFDGIWTNGRCYMAFNGAVTQITEGTPLTQERIYTFENAYPNDLILSEYTDGLIITNYGEPIAIKVSGASEQNAAYNGVYLYYPDDVAHDTPGAQVFKHTKNEDTYLFLYDGKWLLQIDYNWNHGVYKSSRLISSVWFDGGMIGSETVISGMKSELTAVPAGDDDNDVAGYAYKYTVVGAGTAGVDGNYYDTGETTKGPVGNDLGYHIYTNGTAKIEFMIDYSQWSISLDESQKYYIVWDDDAMTTGTTTTVFGEDPAPTISTYSAGNSSSDTTKLPQRVILCGCPMGDDIFTYNETITNEVGYSVYKADNLSHYIYYLNGVWNVHMDYSSVGYFQSPTLTASRGTWHEETGTVVDIMSSGVLDGDSVSGGLACWEYDVCLNEATHYCSKCGHAYCEDHRYDVNLSHNCNV